jgi:hypothetical protein
MEKLTEIKSRLLQFAKVQGYKKEEFYRQIGIDGANFRGKNANSELGSDKIVSILTTFSDLSPDWLLLGKGEMLREKRENVEREGIGFVKIPTDVWTAMQIWTESLKRKDDQISQLIEMLKGNSGNSEGAGQGKKDRHAEEAGGRL